MDKRIKVGIIGTGGISHMHMQGYQALDNVEVCAVCDINEERVKHYGEKYKIKHVFTDYHALLELEELDAVSVCTWNNSHAAASMAALKAGKHVLCEKPMAINTQEALAMENAAREAGKLLMVGFVRRFGRDERVVKDWIDKGCLGSVNYAKASYLRRSGNPGGWFSDRKRSGGGALIDLGVHVIDLVRYFAGKPKAVAVSGATFNNIGPRSAIKGIDRYKASDYSDYSDVEDMAVAMIRFDNGTLFTVETSFSANIKEDTGSIELFGTKSGMKLGDSLEIFTQWDDYLMDWTPKLSKQEKRFEAMFRNETAHFIDCVANGTPCASPAEDGVEVMRILDAIYESAAASREVRIDRG